MLPDIAELEYVRREERSCESEVVDISQDEEEPGGQPSGRPSPCVIEYIDIEGSPVEVNPAARNDDGDSASHGDIEPGRTEDHEDVEDLLKDDDSAGEESQSFNFESGAQSQDKDQDLYCTPCPSPLDLRKSSDLEMTEVDETKEDEVQSVKAVSDTSFLEDVNQDFTEVSNDSNYDEFLGLQAQIDKIVEQQSKSVQIKLNKVSNTDIRTQSQPTTPKIMENGMFFCETEAFEGNVSPKESSQQNPKKRSKRKSSPKSPRRKKQKSAPDCDHDQPAPSIENEDDTGAEERFHCPIEDCSFGHSSCQGDSHPHMYYILKHFISEHLGHPPLKLYDFKRVHKRDWPCSECSYTNESKTSIFAHMAFEHQNLFERISKNASNILKDPSAIKIIDCIDKYLTSNWDKWTSCEQIFDDLSKNENIQVVNEEVNQMPNFVEAPLPVSEEIVFTENTVIPVDLDDETQNESHIVLTHPTAVEERDIFCKVCFHFKFEDVSRLRRHILEEHSGDYQDVPLLEAGEKHYECNLCTHFKRTKSKLVFMKHLKKVHGRIYRGLLDSDEAWSEGVLCEDDFCSPRHEFQPVKPSAPASLAALHDCNPLSSGGSSPLSSPSPQSSTPVPNPSSAGPKSSSRSPPRAPAPPILRENPLFSPGSEDEVEEQSPKSGSGDDDIIEDYAFINTKTKSRRPSQELGLSCKVCDLECSNPHNVSRHVFLTHLEHHEEITKKVWRCLYTQQDDKFCCTICNKKTETEQFAKLHIYNKHKRDLKKMMDRKKIDWKNLLDFIGYNVSENKIQEDESDFEMEDCDSGKNSPVLVVSTKESKITDAVSNANERPELKDSLEEGEIRDEEDEKTKKESSQSVCPFNGCQEGFYKTKIGKRKLVTHYLTTHSESTLSYHLVETLMPGKVSKSSHFNKLNLKKDMEYFYLCTKSSCLATFRTLQALDDHRKLCLPDTAEMLKKCEHCLGIFKFCQEHIAKECVHVGELSRIRDLTT